MNLSIVYSTQQTQFQAATLSGGLEENLSKLANLGYDGVELAIRDPKLVEINDLDQLVKKLNLKVPAIGTGQAWGEEGLSFTDPDPEIRQKAIERILSHIPLAKHFKATIILGLIRGITKPGISQGQAMEWLQDALKIICDAALNHDVRFALEPINRYETSLINNVTQGLELIDAVGYDNFGLLLDTFHMNIEETNMEESIRICGERIFHFHVADSNRWYPGGGHLDFESILKALLTTNYKGFVSGEFLAIPDGEIAAEKNINFLNHILKSIN